MNKDDNQYQPISCELYSEYELAIIRGQKVKLVWQQNDQTQMTIVTPLDLKTKDHQEFLIAEDFRREPLQIRLDYIQRQTFMD